MMSYGSMPIWSAGEPETTLSTTAPAGYPIDFKLSLSYSVLIFTPIYARLTSLFEIISSQSSLTKFEGIANPIPSKPSPPIFDELTPISCPEEFTSAPPELPGFIAASV